MQEHTLTRERPNYIKAQESTRHVTSRLANAEVDVKTLTTANDAHTKYVWYIMAEPAFQYVLHKYFITSQTNHDSKRLFINFG